MRHQLLNTLIYTRTLLLQEYPTDQVWLMLKDTVRRRRDLQVILTDFFKPSINASFQAFTTSRIEDSRLQCWTQQLFQLLRLILEEGSNLPGLTTD